MKHYVMFSCNNHGSNNLISTSRNLYEVKLYEPVFFISIPSRIVVCRKLRNY
eukprot:m.152938 g.152938  ORF g.152938 m.152938 type:complete len:52 (+) comp15060_c0_seq1:2849-3004(+)